MENSDYFKLDDEDYIEIGKRFHQQGREEKWDDTKPLSFDEMPPSFKEKWPWLMDYCIYNLPFSAQETNRYLLGHESYECEHGKFGPEPVKGQEPRDETVEEARPSDHMVEENINFRYPLVRKHPSADTSQKRDRVTIVLHGLNEYSFNKHMPWACQIMLHTQAPVILFPLTFSIGGTRAGDWANLTTTIVRKRKGIEGNENVSLVNPIISERLGTHPERFFWAAVQTYWDLVNLARQINDDRHEHIAPHAQVDFLGYSSGGYLALALLALNHEGLFSKSRACLFATCAEMRSLGSGTPYTLDRRAEVALRDLYVEKVDERANERMKHWFEKEHPEGHWFHSFGRKSASPDRRWRETLIREIEPRLLGIANTNDDIMRLGAMRDVLQGVEIDTGVRIEKLALGIHEHPFVLLDYNQPRREFRRVLNKDLYGSEFKNFIKLIVGHL